jgi:HK97 family phage portal protein
VANALSRAIESLGRKLRPGAASASNFGLGQPEEWFLRAMLGSATAAGVTVTPLAALGVPTVHACVNAVSRSIASIPLKLYRRMPDGGKEVANDHRLYSLLHDAPNEEMTSASFRRAVQANATLRNSGYALIVRDGLREVAELRPIQNCDITPERDAAGVLYYRLKGERVEADSILHISGLTLNGICGVDTIGSAREAIGLAIALQDHGSRFFANASTPSIGIEISANMTSKQVEEFAKAWDAANGGKNQHKRSILWGGAKFAGIPQGNNEQSQFLEAKIYQDKCIAQVYGVPQIKAGITDAAHFSNVEQENQNYVTDTLISWCTQWEQELNHKLLSAQERKQYYFKFLLQGLLRGAMKERFESYQLAIQNGFMTRNEARDLEDLNPVDGGDMFIIPMNMQQLDEAGMPIPVPQTPAAKASA